MAPVLFGVGMARGFCSALVVMAWLWIAIWARCWGIGGQDREIESVATGSRLARPWWHGTIQRGFHLCDEGIPEIKHLRWV